MRARGFAPINEVEQIAQFEFGAVMASEAMKALFRKIRPGMSEFAAVQVDGPRRAPALVPHHALDRRVVSSASTVRPARSSSAAIR